MRCADNPPTFVSVFTFHNVVPSFWHETKCRHGQTYFDVYKPVYRSAAWVLINQMYKTMWWFWYLFSLSVTKPRIRGMAPLILNLGTGWKWVVNFTSRRFYPGKRTPVPTEVEWSKWAKWAEWGKWVEFFEWAPDTVSTFLSSLKLPELPCGSPILLLSGLPGGSPLFRLEIKPHIMTLTPHIHVVLTVRMSGASPLLHGVGTNKFSFLHLCKTYFIFIRFK